MQILRSKRCEIFAKKNILTPNFKYISLPTYMAASLHQNRTHENVHKMR